MTEESKKSVAPVDCTLSNDIVNLYNATSIQNVNEAVTVLFHAFLLEKGFIPKDVSDKDKFQSMPEKWNASEIFKIKYIHYCCPTFTCCMTCVPSYNTITVHGIVCDVECSESVDFKVNKDKYLKQETNFSDVFEVFCNLEELSRHFKDNFCLPLLNLLHETVSRNPLYGMPGLLDELKMYILKYLPVEGVISMSAVSKDFNSLANSTLLWKYLFQRDFSKDNLLDADATSSENNWKQIYKREYLKKKRKSEQRIYRYPPYRLPEIFRVGPDYEFNPPLPEVFPPYFPLGRPCRWWM